MTTFEKMIVGLIALVVALAGLGMLYVSTVGWEDYKQSSIVRESEGRTTPLKTERNRWMVGVVGLGLLGISGYVLIVQLACSEQLGSATFDDQNRLGNRSKRQTD